MDLANASIRENRKQFHKTLRAHRNGTEVKPALVTLYDNHQQANFVAQRVLELRDEGVDLNEMSILYRAHYQSLEVQFALTRAGIPFSITSGLRFFEQAHVKDVAAFMKFAVNPSDEVAFKRIARLLPGVAAKTADKLWEQLTSAPESEKRDFETWLGQCRISQKTAKLWQQLGYTLDELVPDRQPLPPAEMIGIILEAMYGDYLETKYTNHEQRREDISAIESFAGSFKNTVDFLSQLSLMSTADADGTRVAAGEADKITLSTIHQAKGLEWGVVFLIWLADGKFPSARSFESADAIEEERRLFYVACTRAQDQLYLCSPSNWTNAPTGDELQQPSRFLNEIPKELLEKWWIHP